MQDIEILTLEMPEHVAHVRQKNEGKSIDQLVEDRKKIAGDKTTAANLGRCMFEAGLELAEGRFKVMNETFPKFVKAVGYEVVETKVRTIKLLASA